MAPLLVVGALLLSACAAAAVPASAPLEGSPIPAGGIPAGIDPFASSESLARVDEQGAIVVEITPLDLGTASEQIEFEVALNTHSIDLVMDLAPLSTLTTDTGLAVAAESWDAPLGGHHTSGRLTFPLTQDASTLFRGASTVTLTITDLEVPSRVFEWALR
jgi:hypothetical protein